MIENYLKVAWRSLKRHPFFAILNTVGLAIGMSSALLISLYIYDELSYDRMFTDHQMIHRLNSAIKFGGSAGTYAVVPAPMASTLRDISPAVEEVMRFRTRGSYLIKKSDSDQNTKEEDATYADSTFFKVFDLELLYGDKATALTQPNTVVLTRSAAEKHFDISQAVDQTVVLENDETYTVTGVIEDFPENSFLSDHTVFMAMSGYEDAQNQVWGSNNYQTFVKLKPSATVEDLNGSLDPIVADYVMPWAQTIFPGVTREQFEATGNYIRFETIPLTDIHLHSDRVAEMSLNGDIQNVYILFFIALFLLVLASVNFMNLSTARSLKRSREVGIRKTLGSDRRGLIFQFLTESGLITFISLLAAILIAYVAMPYFNDLAGKNLSIPLQSPVFWVILLIATIFLGTISGSYPAFFMSAFETTEVLKGQLKIGGGGIRNALVIFQFAISIFLIVCTIVVYQQLDYIQNKDLGYTKEQVLVIQDLYGAGDQVDAFKEEVLKLPEVVNASISSFLPTPSSRSDGSLFEKGRMEQENAVQMQRWQVDFDYVSTLDLEIIAGRDFDKAYSTDSSAIIINETAVANMGKTLEEAIGVQFVNNFADGNPTSEEGQTYFTVIGVVKNFHFESLREDIGALSMTIGRSRGLLPIKLTSVDYTGTIASIENLWTELAPGQPFNYFFLEEDFNETYEAEKRLGEIFIIFTILSILIACLGLFGLASFNAEKRTKEIGVRKVMGATVGQIAYRLSVDFLKLVGIAIAFSLPLGWLAMNQWLQDFTYQINMSVWVFFAAAAIAVVISMVTVSFQSIKASLVNPVESLRSE